VQQLEAATVAWYRSAVERHIIPELGAVKLTALTAAMIETFLAEKAASGRLDGKGGLGPASVRRLQVTLHKALDAAVRHRLLTVNPVDLADKPKVPRADVTETVWTPEQMATFLAATKGADLHPLWHVACWTGLRRSELAGLQWRDLELDLGVLSVKRARTSVDGKTVLKGPKSATSRRSLDLDDQTVSVLKSWRATQNKKRLIVGEAWDPSEWVFTDNLGQPWRPDGLTKRFKKAAKAAGLPPTDIKGLRHAHATALLKAGVHPKVVQERLGHSSISVTMDTYSSVLPGMQREAVERLASMMSGR
jgi:integrase